MTDTARVAYEQDQKKQFQKSVIVAIVVHTILIVVLIWLVLPSTPPELPIINGIAAPPEEEVKIHNPLIDKPMPRKPATSSPPRVKLVSSATKSTFTVPSADVPYADQPIGFGESLGEGFGEGEGDGDGGGGSVRFFGRPINAKRVVFLVDFSDSMNEESGGEKRIKVLKKELVRSVAGLPEGLKFNVIYFSGAGWTGGESSSGAGYSARLNGAKAPSVKWHKAGSQSKKKVVSEVKGMATANRDTGGGTAWLPPVRMALNMKPPPTLIYLLTDGRAQDATIFLDALPDLNKRGVVINTISMEMPGSAASKLNDISVKTGGSFSIIMEGRTRFGADALNFIDPTQYPD